MKISKENFYSLSSNLNIPQEKVEALWAGLEKLEDKPESTPFTKYLFYLGALITIFAMTWFMSLGWEQFGGGGLFLIALGYGVGFTLLGSRLWNKQDLKIPAGLLITMAVCMVPLAIYGLEGYFNFWPTDNQDVYRNFYSYIEGKWIFMEIGTILAGIIAVYFFPFPFLTAPIFFAAWFLTMDIVPFIFGKEVNWHQKAWISLAFGLALLAIGFVIDRKNELKYAFWSYFFGTLSFWGGLNGLVWDKSEGILVIYLIINLIMMCLAVLLRRNVLMVFGALGVFAYLSYLAYSLFEDSILFPFVLSFLGLVVIYLGVLYQKNLDWIQRNIFENLPSGVKNFLNSHDNH